MATTIVTKNGTGAPTDSDLVAGELAVDLTNGRLYTTDLDSGGTVIEIGLNPSGNVDVTGTVTADGLTVDGSTTFTGNTSPASDEVLLNLSSLNGTGTAGNMLRFTDLDPTATNNGSIGKIQFYSEDTDAVVVEIEGQNADASPDGRLIFKTAEGTTLRKRINIENNGDISFYEDTGTTAKLVWDASAEQLAIGSNISGIVPFTISADSGSGGAVAFLRASGTNNNGLVVDVTNTPLNYVSDFRIGNTSVMRIDPSGNVGIGTDSPATTLHVENDASTSEIIRIGSSTVTHDTGLYMRTTGTAGISWGTGGALAVYGSGAGSAERMRIDASGNLLVGKTAADGGVNGGEIRSNGETYLTATSAQPLALNRKSTDGAIATFAKDGTSVGTIGNNTDFYIASQDGVGLRFTSTQVLPCSESGAIQNGSRDLGSSSGRFKDLYLSGGVYLGGTGAANKLDDYEEGTWTAAINYGTPTGTAATLSEDGGTYTKVGRLVTVNAEIDVSNTNGGSGDVYILGLPFTVADLLSPTGLEASGIIGYFTGFSSGVNSMTVGATDGGTYMGLYGLTSSTATAINTITAADMGTGELRLSLTYFTT